MPSISLAVSLRGQLLSGTRSVAPTPFSPIDLFASNEPGVWYDPSDITTLFQDVAGTIPVTSPGEVVGLMLDKSKGLVLGTELVVNGTFASGTTTGWTPSFVTLSVVDFRLRIVPLDNDTRFTWQSFATVAGRTYNLSFAYDSGTMSQIFYSVGTSSGASNNIAYTQKTGVATISLFFVATGTTTFINFGAWTGNSGKEAFFDNISVKELAGNHATQATAASRPTYGVVPTGGRRNLLTWSEDFRTTAQAGSTRPWTTTAASVTANAAVAPDSTTTADQLTLSNSNSAYSLNFTSIPAASSSTYTLSVYIKVDTLSEVSLFLAGANSLRANFNIATQTVSGVGASISATSITAAGDGWYRCSLTGVYAYPGSNGPGIGQIGVANGNILIWGAQLELGSTATAYQKVTTQYDVTEAGVTSCPYLFFDGTSDAMVSSTITPGIDKAQVFAGLRKLSDAASGILLEQSANFNTNAGTLALSAPDSTLIRYAATSRGSATAASNQRADITTTGASPDTAVLTATYDIASDLVNLRRNGALAATATGDQGTGNFLAYPLYLGARGGTSLFFNGNLFSLITRFGANLDTTTINSTEYWVGNKTGINIANNISTTIFARDDTAVLDRANSIIERRA